MTASMRLRLLFAGLVHLIFSTQHVHAEVGLPSKSVPVVGVTGASLPPSIENKIQRLKEKVDLPRKNTVPSLDTRAGLTQQEGALLTVTLAPDSYKKAVVAAEMFWQSPLLTSIVSVGRSSFIEDSDPQIEDWVSFGTEENLGLLFGKKELSNFPVVNTVYLSGEGFSKIQSSKEMVPASGRDLLASVAVADFCERTPGKSIPFDFSIRFSPWDFASKLAASSRLELSLLELVLQPDALKFSGDDEDEDEDEQGDDEAVDDKAENLDLIDLVDSGGWDLALSQFESQINAGTLSVAQLATKIRRDVGIEQRIRRLVLAAAVATTGFKKNCDGNGGKWRELFWTKDHWLEFFSCRNAAGKDVGPLFTIEDGNFKNGQMEFLTASGPVKIKASVAGRRAGMRTQLLFDEKPMGMDTWFSSDGSVLATDDHSGNIPAAFVFDQKGQCVWSRINATDTTLKNESWYSNGAVKSFIYEPTDGTTSAMVGYHKNGLPKYWLPIRSGRPDGKFLWWHPSGKIAGELDYVAGKRFGIGRLYYENGSDGFRADYSEDTPHGRLIWRDPAGHPLFSLGFTGGKANGLLEIRYGGRHIAEARFEAGVVEGTVILRNVRGIGVAEIPYRGGLLNGTVILRDGVGATRVKSNWLDGQADGDTDSNYSSGVAASLCKFKNGELQEWKSFDPSSKLRYSGKVSSPGAGVSEIDFYGGSNQAVLKCVSKEWSIESCLAIDGDRRIKFPSLKDFIPQIEDAGDLKFKPERCGGVVRALDVSPFVDHGTGNVEVTYRTKEMCPVNLATAMQCDVIFENGKWTPSTCVLADGDSDYEEED